MMILTMQSPHPRIMCAFADLQKIHRTSTAPVEPLISTAHFTAFLIRLAHVHRANPAEEPYPSFSQLFLWANSHWKIGVLQQDKKGNRSKLQMNPSGTRSTGKKKTLMKCLTSYSASLGVRSLLLKITLTE